MADGQTKLVGEADFNCETRIRGTDYDTIRITVSVPKVEGEKPEDTLKRFKEAAEELNGNFTGGCFKRNFIRFASLPDEVMDVIRSANKKKAEEKKAEEKKAKEAQKPAMPSINYYDPCLGEWKNRPLCKK